ncbi:MAG: TolC family protein [Planctomycetota bacterium]|nr:TolC family protein [Planctomycetota bacterium]
MTRLRPFARPTPTSHPRHRISIPERLALASTLAVAMAAGGCHSPLRDESEQSLRESVVESVRRQTGDAERSPAPRVTEREEGVSRLGIRPQFLPEVESMAGPEAQARRRPVLGDDLLGKAPSPLAIGLERVVKTTVRNNLQVQFATLAPAIAESRVTAAEAAFDWTLFSNFQNTVGDSPRTRTAFGGFSSGPNNSTSNALEWVAGVRRPLVTGGRFTLQQSATYTDDYTAGQTVTPDPSGLVAVTAQYDQPLLRGAGSEVSLAEVRLSRNAESRAIADLKRELIAQVTDAEQAYWQLARSYRDLIILESLVERGELVRDQLRNRGELVAPAQIADAVARVETRVADVLRARTALRLASNRVKVLMNDPELTIGSEALLVPADDSADTPLNFSLLESMLAAVKNRPEVQQAILTIDDTSIRQVVAQNARLPQLDARLQARWSSLKDNTGDAYADVLSGQFVDYLMGLVFEYPLGNRGPEAQLRQRRLERSQAAIAYRNAVQTVIGEVKNALEQVTLNYRLIEKTRTARLAAAESLRTFLVEKENIVGFTVERLNVEFQRQESLAQAEREEVAALTDYQTSVAELYRAMGTALERNKIEFNVPDAPDRERLRR